MNSFAKLCLGCVVACLVVFVVVVGGCVVVVGGIKGCASTRQNAESRAREATDKELSEYARREVPELQELIDKMMSEIADRKNRLRQLEEALSKVDKDPASDEEHKRWSSAIREMEKTKEDLLASRNELYLAFRKYELAPTGTQASAERSEAIAGAKGAVEVTRKAFLEQMKEIENSP